MACRITELVLDSRNPRQLATFWCDVLGYVVISDSEDEVEIGLPGSDQPTIVFGRGEQPKREKLRLHIDVNPTDRDQHEELERLLALGATRVDIGQTGDESWYVLADPEGNEFCLLRTRVERPVVRP